jgi:hypothetical protein
MKQNLIQNPITFWLIGLITAYLGSIINFIGIQEERKKERKNEK